MKGLSVRTVVATGITAAIFYVLFLFVRIPTGIPNTDFLPAYGLLGMMAAIFGPVCGLLGGLIGHLLADATSYGVWWSWAIASGVLGFIIGWFRKWYKVEEGGFKWKECLIFNAVQIVGNIIAWGAVAPVLDILMYAEPTDKVFTQGLIAGMGDAINILVLGSILLFAYSNIKSRSSGLKKES